MINTSEPLEQQYKRQRKELKKLLALVERLNDEGLQPSAALACSQLLSLCREASVGVGKHALHCAALRLMGNCLENTGQKRRAAVSIGFVVVGSCVSHITASVGI